MANAPKKRPPNMHGGRPPRGPRPVATSPDLRTNLKAAATQLRQTKTPALAEAIDTVLAPGGWKALRNTDSVGTGDNLSIRMIREFRDQVVAAARAAGDTVTAGVNEGFALFLAGEFTPRPPAKGPAVAEADKVNLNVRPNAALHGRVRESGLLPQHVAAEYLMHKYQVGSYAPGYRAPLAPGADRNPSIPRVVRDLIRDRAAAQGNKVNHDIDEGFTKFLAGEFVPTAPVWPAGVEKAPLKSRPNNDLFTQVKVAAREAGLRPMQVAIAYLLEKYDIDPAVAAE